MGSIKSVIKPTYKQIKAVDNISFNLKKGELVAFIGPNGAGKSTTLKMLSGILFRDSGAIKISNLDPQKQRKVLAYKIGTVFGQKPQLWFHLPAIDTFHLFAKIYDLKKDEFEKRIKLLIKVFEIEDIVKQPVRKLSLGQRMRCEFVLALIHKPEVLFLDEPTIGLDMIVKKNIRELIKKINKEEKVTVILTSHDMGDVEELCDRLIVINHGRIIFDGSLSSVKKKILKTKILNVVSDKPLKIPNNKNLRILSKKKFSASIEIKNDALTKTMDILLKSNPINDFTIKDLLIEEII